MQLTIIIPTYNRANTIGRTLDSFIAQDFKDWEMIVVDDFSTDPTKDVIFDYHCRDNRINYLLNERNKGAQGARNTGIIHAKSDWVVLFDSDDYAYPFFLSRMLSGIDESTDVITCYVRKVWVDGSQSMEVQWGGSGYIEENLLRRIQYVNFCNSMFRKSKLIEIGLLDESCPAYQEFDTHIRLSRICNYKWIKEVLVDYMWGGNDTISANNNRNDRGFVYVILHNKRRYKELAADVYWEFLMQYYRHMQWPIKREMLIKEPLLIFMMPLIYYRAFKRYLKHKFGAER